VRFWDSSAVVPLLIEERQTRHLKELYREDALLTVWWATEIECASAFRRRERLGLDSETIRQAFERLAEARADWQQIEPVEEVRRLAVRLLRFHDLSAADALQLAAASTASGGEQESLGFVTLDDRLRLAAEREGFPVLP
jgi:predicted nucleic acid-binding protein